MKRAAVAMVCGLLLSPCALRAAVEVILEAAHDTSPRLDSFPANQLNASEAARPQRQVPLGRLIRRAGPAGPVTADTAVQTSVGSLISVTAGNNFDGVGEGFVGPQATFTVTGIPPDTNGAVGNTQYVQLVNTSFAVFDKATGTAVYGPVATNSLWSGFGGQCETNNDGDGIVLYDKAANRWVFSQFAVNGGARPNYYECIAVSTTSDATGAYYRYAFQMANFPDYPKIAVWPDAYYASFNLFTSGTGTFINGLACAFDRASMLAGATASMQCFQPNNAAGGLLPSDLDGSRPPPAGSPNYFLALDPSSSNALDLWKFHVDFAVPANSTFTGPSLIQVAGYTQACAATGTCVPQPGTSQQLDSLGDRLMHRLAYRNFGSYETLVANHSVTVGSSAGVRWYELRNPGGTPVIYQQGTYAPDTADRWMGSIGMDAKANIAVGYSTSSSSVFPSISYTGRLVGDPLGTMQTENLIISGSGSQIPQMGQTGANRWGDYSGMTIDPVDDCTFWYTNEYLKTTGVFNWSTRIASFKFPQCAQTNAIVPILASFLLLQ